MYDHPPDALAQDDPRPATARRGNRSLRVRMIGAVLVASVTTVGVGIFGVNRMSELSAKADLTNATSVREAVKSATAVINLCGVFGRAMRPVHVDGARTVAEAAREAGAGAMVQVSAIGADVDAQSVYGRTKGQGEVAVREAFPGATVIRPSLVFGPEDNLTNRFAAMARLPFLPVIAGKRNFQPVYVRDLAQAIALAALEPGAYGGKTFEIGGPQVMSMAELHQTILELTGQSPEVVHLPDVVASSARSSNCAPGRSRTPIAWSPGANGCVSLACDSALTRHVGAPPCGAITTRSRQPSGATCTVMGACVVKCQSSSAGSGSAGTRLNRTPRARSRRTPAGPEPTRSS